MQLVVRTLAYAGLAGTLLAACGDDNHGDLAGPGDPDAGATDVDAAPPDGMVEPPSTLVPQQLAVGLNFACAIIDGGHVKCWGRNSNGQLGQGDTDDRGDSAGEMAALGAIDLGAGRTAMRIGAGVSHACALLDDASVKCWGRGASAQLGYGDPDDRGNEAGEMGDALPAVALGAGFTPVELTVGRNNVCVRDAGGHVKCWGPGGFGQLLTGDTTAHRGDAPDQMGDAMPFLDVGTGRTVATMAHGPGVGALCALLDDGALKCFGDDEHGQLGAGSREDLGDEPDEVGDGLAALDLGGATIRQVSFDGLMGCVTTAPDDAVKCWGQGAHGALGVGATDDRGDDPGEMGAAIPTTPVARPTGSDLRIATGLGKACVYTSQEMRCWGQNDHGQLGLGSTDDVGDASGEVSALPAIDFGTSHTIRSVALGENATCVMFDDLSVKCVGQGTRGALGADATADFGDEAGETWATAPFVGL